MREWNAEAYHQVSNPHINWGVPVLARLPLEGDERVMDVGCGTGRLTEKLLERLPRGHVVAIDLSENMLQTARAYLTARFAGQVTFVRTDAASLPFENVADAIFSTATLHWILDHEGLFRSLYRALKPGGRLVAQCGGGPNLRQAREQSRVLMTSAEFAPYFSDWSDPWEYADAITTEHRLRKAGFVDARTSVEAAPVVQPDATAYRAFVEPVIFRAHLARLPDERLRQRFIDLMTEHASRGSPPFELDYWRLNLEGRKPER
jgi:trans-aconitate 2-methyltransferase